MNYNSRMPSRLKLVSTARLDLVTLVAILTLSACSPRIDLPASLAVEDVTTGWLDAGIDDSGRNKLVPTISFRLENLSSEHVGSLQVNSIFRRCLVAPAGQPEPVSEVSPANPSAGTCAGEMQEWGSSFIRAVGREGLVPGGSTDAFTLKSGLGYTGEQPRLEMLQHRGFVDVKVELFAKHGPDQWVRLGEHPITRHLLTQ